MRHHPEIRQRDNDGLFDVVCGDVVAGPFPSWAFAARVASGNQPEPVPAAKARRFKAILEVHRNA